MVVYVVEAGYKYEGYEALSVWDNEEDAQSEVSKIKEFGNYDNVVYSLMTVNESYL